MKSIPFYKMHGLGNDFILINAINQSIDLKQLNIPKLADRYFGIGFDQLLLLSSSNQADFSCRFFNADGSEAEQCGNGMRCVGRFIHEEKLSPKKLLMIETKAGMIEVNVKEYADIEVNMGVPRVLQEHCHLQLNSEKKSVELFTLSMGNPHAILKINSIKNAPVKEWGSAISTHAHFPEGTNVGFMEIVDRQHIRLRTFERGVGETFACGSNACAAVAAGIVQGLLDSKVKIELAFGNLWVEWKGGNHSLVLSGPAEKVFTGVVNVPSR